jgi:hypothetical protein
MRIATRDTSGEDARISRRVLRVRRSRPTVVHMTPQAGHLVDDPALAAVLYKDELPGAPGELRRNAGPGGGWGTYRDCAR